MTPREEYFGELERAQWAAIIRTVFLVGTVAAEQQTGATATSFNPL